MNRLPDRPRPDAPVPEPRLSPEQFEAVIRRAAELQARSAEQSLDESGVSRSELVRIGREIGLSPQHVQQALAETVGSQPTDVSLKARLFGPAAASAGRAVPGAPGAVRAHLDRYLVEREWLSVMRRFADRTLYQKARGFDLARVAGLVQDVVGGASRQPQVGAGFKLRNARRVEVTVQPLEEGYSYLSISVDLSNYRTGFAAAGIGGGGAAGIGVASVLGIAVDPAAALLGVPVAGGSLLGFRALQGHCVDHAQTHVEGLLDCLERGEPLVRVRATRP
ncbi:MAG: hypothetical protein KY464_13905 [Gemmatimonadetes bacterium]|nr:hypothetical protein [Gemmatimonadota bacterium]